MTRQCLKHRFEPNLLSSSTGGQKSRDVPLPSATWDHQKMWSPSCNDQHLLTHSVLFHTPIAASNMLSQVSVQGKRCVSSIQETLRCTGESKDNMLRIGIQTGQFWVLTRYLDAGVPKLLSHTAQTIDCPSQTHKLFVR